MCAAKAARRSDGQRSEAHAAVGEEDDAPSRSGFGGYQLEACIHAQEDVVADVVEDAHARCEVGLRYLKSQRVALRLQTPRPSSGRIVNASPALKS